MAVISLKINSQEIKAERTHSFKVTYPGFAYAYEQPISVRSVLNMEFSLSAGSGYTWTNGTNWAIYPSFRIEPRHYYNLLKRQSKEFIITNNSADYIALAVDYQPGLSLGGNIEPIQYIALMPKWGLRRTIYNNFFIEFAIGYGVYKSEIKNWTGVPGLDLKVGLRI